MVPSKFGVVNFYPQTKEFRKKDFKVSGSNKYSYTCSDICSVNVEIKKIKIQQKDP